MAKIKEELLIIKISTIHKNGGEGKSVITSELALTLEQVASELIGDAGIVEVQTIDGDDEE